MITNKSLFVASSWFLFYLLISLSFILFLNFKVYNFFASFPCIVVSYFFFIFLTLWASSHVSFLISCLLRKIKTKELEIAHHLYLLNGYSFVASNEANMSANFFIIKPTRCTNFTNFILERNSLCFGQFIRPSSGVYSLYTQQ